MFLSSGIRFLAGGPARAQRGPPVTALVVISCGALLVGYLFGLQCFNSWVHVPSAGGDRAPGRMVSDSGIFFSGAHLLAGGPARAQSGALYAHNDSSIDLATCALRPLGTKRRFLCVAAPATKWPTSKASPDWLSRALRQGLKKSWSDNQVGAAALW